MNGRQLRTVLALSFISLPSAQALPITDEGTPFAIVGYIQSFKMEPKLQCANVDPALHGAIMVVNGIEVIIPCHTIVTMPATYLTPKDIFDFNPARVAGESGLALEDTQPPAKRLPAYEVSLVGNLVRLDVNLRNSNNSSDKLFHVAGLVGISQQSLNAGAGYITAIDADGTLHIGGGSPSTTDARVRINDTGGPNLPPSEGRFGSKTATLALGVPLLAQDGRFTADTGNPTIHSKTGYPMCIERVPNGDSKCPRKNRPRDGANQFLSFFVMDNAGLPSPAPGQLPIPPCVACDPEQQAPLMVGDYVNYAGTMAQDPTGYYVSAHTIDAWVGIYTKPGAGAAGTVVAYLNQEVSLIGTGSVNSDPVVVGGRLIDHEVAPRQIKVVGFTTDPSRSVKVFALQFDTTSCAIEEVEVGQVTPEAVPFGRFRFIITRAGVGRKGTTPSSPPVFVVTAPVKELRVKQDRADKENVANRLTSGQFDAPVSEVIFAENTFFGDPLVPSNFHRFPYLVEGSGNLGTAGRTDAAGNPTGPRIGQLIPWPGAGSFGPPVKKCP